MQPGLRTTEIKLSFKYTEPRASNSKFATSPSLPPSLSLFLSGHFPWVVAAKWAPSHQVKEKWEMLLPCLRKEPKQNRSHLITKGYEKCVRLNIVLYHSTIQFHLSRVGFDKQKVLECCFVFMIMKMRLWNHTQSVSLK